MCVCTGLEKSEFRVHRGRARARVYVAHRTRRISGGRILEKPRPERHWPPTEPRVPLLGQSRRELITAAVLLSAFRLLKTLRFRALYQRGGVRMYGCMYVRTYICMPIRATISCPFRRRSPPRRSTIFFFSVEEISRLAFPLVPYRWMLEIVRSSVFRRSLLILPADSSNCSRRTR